MRRATNSPSNTRAALACGLLVALYAVPFARLAAQDAGETARRVERLSLELERTESLRAIKQLQRTYAQYAQAGLWGEMAALFARDGELVYGDDTMRGREAIERYFRAELGHGHPGLPVGAVHVRLNDRPVVNLAADGESAKGRWLEFAMYGAPQAQAGWAGGIQTNDYVREDGVWKFARLQYHAQLAGSYEDGWTAIEPDIAIVPYHFTPDEAGVPVPPVPEELMPPPGGMSAAATAERLSGIERRVSRLVEHDEVLNLYHAYGYYLDRKMWDDVTDLFTSDGVLTIGGVGSYRGVSSIRRALERDGPSGLRRGELNDHVLFDTVVEVSPSGTEARSRGLELLIEGDNASHTATLAVLVNEGLYEKTGDTWRISEIRSYSMARTNYYEGWAKSSLDEPLPAPGFEPDRPLATSERQADERAFVEFFSLNPVTGRPVAVPGGVRRVAAIAFSPDATRAPEPAGRRDFAARIAEAERLLRVARAYDGVENISGAFGDWLDDFQWAQMSALFARDGRRRKYMLGFYVGPERIRAAETMMYGAGPRSPRTSVAVHHRLQNVIDVAPDGGSAKLRTRLINIGIGERPGSFMAGMYPNDAARLEDGVWRFMNLSIDEPYWASSSYADGWARAKDPEPTPEAVGAPPPLSPFFTRLLEQLPPDIPLAAMPKRQVGFVPGAIVSWPDIKPMWFHYRNPVSGREPPYFCPDEFTCEELLERKAAGTPAVWTPVELPAPVEVREGYVSAGGVDLWYWDTGGDGEVVVLCHPGSQSGLIWPYQQAFLAAAGYRVIAYSRRGHYRSGRGPADDPGTTVDDLVRILDSLEVERAHVVGAAAGGIVAMAFAVAHPERTRSLVLAGSIVGPDEPEWREMFERLEMNEARQHLSAAFLELSASYRAGNPAGTELFERLSETGRADGPVAQPSGVTVNWDVMEALDVPVLLLTGEADLYSPPSMQRLFAQHLRDYELAVVPEAAHAVYWEQPEAFNRIVGEFLRKHRSTALRSDSGH